MEEYKLINIIVREIKELDNDEPIPYGTAICDVIRVIERITGKSYDNEKES